MLRRALWAHHLEPSLADACRRRSRRTSRPRRKAFQDRADFFNPTEGSHRPRGMLPSAPPSRPRAPNARPLAHVPH